MLSNWFCFPLWVLAAFTFFQDRIPYEEYHLIKFFGADYIKYCQETSIGIPFLKGYLDQKDD